MKITTTAENLAAALRSNVCEKHSTIPVLAFARFQGNRVITSDLDRHCITTLDAEVIGEPDFLVPCRRLLKMVDERTGPLTLERLENGVKLTHGGFTWCCESNPVANFPSIPDVPLLTIEFDGAEFKKMIDRAHFSISSEESRYVLNGALLKFKDGKATMVATDGHRMSIVDMPFDTIPQRDELIPSSALKWLMDNAGETVTFAFGAESHAVKVGNSTLIFRTLKGQFPDWEAEMPKEADIKTVVKLSSIRGLKEELARVARCSYERSGCTKWHFGQESRITASSIETGDAASTLDCTVEGDDIALGWNANYILDLLGIVEDGPLTIKLVSNQNAALFELDGMQYVVMPMRI